MTAPREGRRCLHQQRRFADTRIAADQDRRTAHKTAAGRPVELADPCRNARRFLDLAGKRGERDSATLFGRLARPGTDAAHRILFDDGIPLAAAFAFSRPAGVNRAAVLAHELGLGFGHLMSVFFLFEIFDGNVLMAMQHAQNGKFILVDTKENNALTISDAVKPGSISAS